MCLRKSVRASGSYQEQTGNSGLQHVAPHTRLRLEFPPETGLILRCAGKVEIPFLTKQGSRPSCRNQEGRRGSYEAMLGTSVLPSSETAMSGNFWGRIRCQVPFLTSRMNAGLLSRRCSGQGPHLVMKGKARGFFRVAMGLLTYDGEFRLPLVLAQGSPNFHSSCEGELGMVPKSLQGKRDLS